MSTLSANPTARIVFAGTPAFAVPTLQQLAASNHKLVGVLTQPDRPAGRGRQMQASPVKELAVSLGLPIAQPATLKDPQIATWLADLQPELMVIVAYGLLLPKTILQLPVRGCVNVHASLLPRWRGASPIQSAILHGDRRSGVSIMQMEAGLDTGPVYAKCELDIRPDETADELHDRLSELGAQCLMDVVPRILDGSLVPQPQDDTRATHAGRISKADARIDWTAAAKDIHNQIRAYNSWPVAETLLDGKRLRCWTSQLASGEAPGTDTGVIVSATEGALRVQTGDGLLDLQILQLPSRQRMSADELQRGYAGSLTGKQLGQ